MAPRSKFLRTWLLCAVAAALASLRLASWAPPDLGDIGQAAAGVSTDSPCAEIEEFLRTATIGRQRDLPVGATAPTRATLTGGTMQHDASIQMTDVSLPTYETRRRTEVNFRDSWKYNVAGYEIAKLLSLNMVPPYVERPVSGHPASLSWWVNDATMEVDWVRRETVPPDVQGWLDQVHAVRVFRQLIYDTDPNQTNLLITRDWRIWIIDFTRAFRLMKQLQSPKDLIKCDRRLLANLRRLTPEVLNQKVGRWLTSREIEAVLARRDLIVRFFDDEVKAKGQAAVLYDLPRTAEPCGTGLK